MNRFWGILIALFALGIALIPQFSNCQYEGRSLVLQNGNTVPMKCLWTARAELVTGISLLAVGAMVAGSQHKGGPRNLLILGMVLSVFAMLIPTNMIGVCQSNMICNTFMRPSMLILGSLTFLASLTGIITTLKFKEKRD
jgi:hypothetical protein